MAAKVKFSQFKLANSVNLAGQLPNVRFFSSSRGNKSRETSKVSSRTPLMQISKTSQQMGKGPPSVSREFKGKELKENRKVLSFQHEKISSHNESLLIESLCVVPKCRRLNPIREKLIRLFNCESRTRTIEKSVITFENMDWVKEDIETPSPVIKPKYLHRA
jgi:hypothetical protein